MAQRGRHCGGMVGPEFCTRKKALSPKTAREAVAQDSRCEEIQSPPGRGRSRRLRGGLYVAGENPPRLPSRPLSLQQPPLQRRGFFGATTPPRARCGCGKENVGCVALSVAPSACHREPSRVVVRSKTKRTLRVHLVKSKKLRCHFLKEVCREKSSEKFLLSPSSLRVGCKSSAAADIAQGAGNGSATSPGPSDPAG